MSVKKTFRSLSYLIEAEYVNVIELIIKVSTRLSIIICAEVSAWWKKAVNGGMFNQAKAVMQNRCR